MRLLAAFIVAIVVETAHAQLVCSSTPQFKRPELREDCGIPGILRAECERRGCCYDDSILYVPWCFKSSTFESARSPGGDSEGSLSASSRSEGGDPPSQGLLPYRPTSAAIQFSGSCLFHCTSVSRSSRIQCGEVGIGEERCLRIGCCFSAGEVSPERRCYHPAGQDRSCPSDRCQIPSGNMVLCASGYIDASTCQRLGCCSGLFENDNRFCYRQEDRPVFLGSGNPVPVNPVPFNPLPVNLRPVNPAPGNQITPGNPSPSVDPTPTVVNTTTPAPNTTEAPTTTERPSFVEMLKRMNGGTLEDISILDMLTKSLPELEKQIDRLKAQRPTTTTTTTASTTTTTTIATTTRITTPTTTQPPPPMVRRCRWGRCSLVPGPTPAPTQCFPTDCGQPRFFPGSTVIPPTDSRKKVVGGTRAHPWSHPWTAMILKREGNRQFLCGAAVICDRWLVTAAHCMNRQSQRTDVPDLDAIFYTVYVGRHVGWKRKPGKQVQIFEGRDGIEYLEQHENFTSGVRRGVVPFDIGLIRLKRRIEFNQYVQPACLPDARPKVDEVLWASGWGITKNRGPNDSALKQVAIKILNETICKQEVPRFNSSNPVGLLCAGGERFHDTCTGDSGGPLVGPKTMGFNRQQRRLIQRWMLYGLTSLGSPSCNTLLFDRQPALYTDIAYYMDWIKARTQHCCR